LPVICVETRHMQAVLKAQINKTDLAILVEPRPAVIAAQFKCSPLAVR
jgi:hypothetical protein